MVVRLLSATAVLLVAACLFVLPGLVLHRTHLSFTLSQAYMRALFRTFDCLVAAFVIGWILEPGLRAYLDRWRARLPASSRRILRITGVTVLCALMAVFVVAFGRWQFGGFDYNILLETGWRQVLGQRPYVDFLTTSPPLFNLGMLAAFRLFGVSWDGMLLFTALFSILTLLWIYKLLQELGMASVAALGAAFTVQAAAMLSCCFWWYNDTTLVLAAVFFLSALALAQNKLSFFTQSSFVASMALLALAKPNIGGVTLLGCTALLLVAAPRRGRVLLLLLAGLGLVVLIFLLGHVSLSAMVAAYRGAAKERGAFSTFGFDEYSIGLKRFIILWYFALCLPLLLVMKPLVRSVRTGQWRAAALCLFYPFSALIAIYGLRGNGELYDLETTVLVVSLALLAFTSHGASPRMRRYVVALFCAMVASNLYVGIARLRVYSIGEHQFFEWRDRNYAITSGPLQHMRVSRRFMEVNDLLHQVVTTERGPFFFGPRVDYAYMAFGLPSPLHFPAWWHPGTAFDRARLPEILSNWEKNRFPTLVFYKDDYTYYPQSFRDTLTREYMRDDRYTHITVYRRRPGM